MSEIKKQVNLKMKSGCLLLSLLGVVDLSHVNHSQAQTVVATASYQLKEGDFIGRYQTRGGLFHRGAVARMMIRSAPGMDGFLTILFVPNQYAGIFHAKQTDSPGQSEYSLTPLSVQANGIVGPSADAEPSHVLTISGQSWPDRDPEFWITSANNSNESGPQDGTFKFYGKNSKYEWLNKITSYQSSSGEYKRLGWGRNAAQITAGAADSDTKSYVFTLTTAWSDSTKKRSGKYEVRERRPGFFTASVKSSWSVGAKTNDLASHVGFFIKSNGRLRFVLVDPKKPAEMIILRRQF